MNDNDLRERYWELLKDISTKQSDNDGRVAVYRKWTDPFIELAEEHSRESVKRMLDRLIDRTAYELPKGNDFYKMLEDEMKELEKSDE